MSSRITCRNCNPMDDVTIIGGGITGLATAFYLERKASSPPSYTLVESARRLGGKIVTERVDGFVIEGGPDSFQVPGKPWFMDLCHDLGLSDELIPMNEGRQLYVLRNGRLERFPLGFRLAVPTGIFPIARTSLFSPWGKLRMAAENGRCG